MMKKQKTQLAACGILAGFTNGFFGAGGGLFLVPLLIGWVHLEETKAFATSVFIILPLSIASAITYSLSGNLDFAGALPYMIGGAAGGLLAGQLLERVSTRFLRRILGCMILYGGIRAVLLL